MPSLPLPHDAQRKQVTDFGSGVLDFGFENESGRKIRDLRSKIQNRHRGMVSMVSMEVSKTLGPGSSPGTPARNGNVGG